MSGHQELSRDVDIDFRGLVAQIWRRKWRILLSTLIAGFALMFLLTLVAPKYQSSARILIENRESVFTRNSLTENRSQFDKEAITSQVEVIRADNVALAVIKKLRLAEKKEFAGPFRIWATTDLLAYFGKGAPVVSSPEERALIRFNEKLKVFSVTDSRVIVIQFSSVDPRLAKAVPNTVADEYLAIQKSAKLASSETATEWLGPEIAELRERVRAAESKVAEFRASSDILVGNNNALLSTQQLSEVSSELSRLRAERSSAEAKVASIRSALQSGSSLEVIPEVIASPLIQRLRESEVALRAQISELSITLLPNHPRLKALKSQMNDFKQQIRMAAQNISKSLENNVLFTRRKESELLAEVNRLKSEAARVDEAIVELRVLEREATAEREQLQNYLKNYREAASRQNSQYLPVNARIISRAALSAQPYFPKIIPFAVFGALVTMLIHLAAILTSALVSGAGFKPAGAMAREMPPQSIPVAEPVVPDTPQSIPVAESVVPDTPQSKPVAEPVVPDTPQSKPVAEPVVPDTPQSKPVAEPIVPDMPQVEAVVDVAEPVEEIVELEDEVPALATDDTVGTQEPIPEARGGEETAVFPARFAAEGISSLKKARILVLTPGEEQSPSTASLLARWLAAGGQPTVLMDLTTNGCSSLDLLGGSQMKGIGDVLSGTAPFKDIVYQSRNSAAHVLPVGVGEPSQMSGAAGRLALMADTLQQRYAYLLLDCGNSTVEDLKRVADADSIIIVNGTGASLREQTKLQANLFSDGYSDVILVTPDEKDLAQSTAAA